MIQVFLDTLDIPDACTLNKTLFKKLFLESGQLDVTDKKALRDDIDKIRWLYTLKPSTINIAPYKDDEREYDEVAILQIDLSSITRAKRIAHFVNKAIPYPIVLIFTQGDSLAISVADKRINQADKSKWVVGDGWMTRWLNPGDPSDTERQFMDEMSLKTLSFVNFYALYSDIQTRVIALNAADRSGRYDLGDKTIVKNRLSNLRRIGELESEITTLRAALKKENQFNAKLNLNVTIKTCEDEITKLEEQL